MDQERKERFAVYSYAEGSQEDVGLYARHSSINLTLLIDTNICERNLITAEQRVQLPLDGMMRCMMNLNG